MSKNYKADKDGFILGTYYKKDEPVPVTEAQAKYLMPPLGDSVLEVSVTKAVKPALKALKSETTEKAE